MNGYRLEFDDRQAFAFLMNLYETGRMRFPEIEAGFVNTPRPAPKQFYSGLQDGSFTENAAAAVH